MISLVQLIAQRLCQGKYVETSKGLSPQLLNKETVRAFKILHSSHLPCLFGEPPGMQPRRYLAIVRIWPRISPPGETCVCTFAYAAPARMAVMTAARSPAWSCCGAWGPAMTFAAVITPATVPSRAH